MTEESYNTDGFERSEKGFNIEDVTSLCETCDQPVTNSDRNHSWCIRLNPINAMTNVFRERLHNNRRSWPNLVSKSETLEIYDRVKSTGTYNVLVLREELPSTLKYANWERAKTGHIDDEWVVDLVKFGFPLQFHEDFGCVHDTHFPNHASGENYPKHVEQYIAVKTHNNTLLGPFNESPFTRMNVAPIMTRPKSEPTKRRIIVDYTYPEGIGINAHIHKNKLFGVPLHHSLPTVGSALNVIRDKQFRVKLATIDLERAYRNFKTDPYDWPLTAISFQGQYYVDTGVPFGSRASSLYVQRIAEFITRALYAKGIYMSMYLDDGLIISDDGSDHHAILAEVIATIRSLGLPLAWDKIQTPSKVCVFLGIEIDIGMRETRIPIRKLRAFREQLRQVRGTSTITRTQLQSIIGSVNHIAKCVCGARLFMNRLLTCLRENQGKTIKVSPEIIADLDWFDRFALHYNGRSMIVSNDVFATISVDSCLVGSAGVCGRDCHIYI